MEAYLKPQVDTDDKPLEWARPDLHGLRVFAASKFGWTDAKTDEMLLPVLRAFDQTFSQSRMEAFFPFEHRFARFRSSRLAATVKPDGQQVEEEAEEAEEVAVVQRKEEFGRAGVRGGMRSGGDQRKAPAMAKRRPLATNRSKRARSGAHYRSNAPCSTLLSSPSNGNVHASCHHHDPRSTIQTCLSSSLSHQPSAQRSYYLTRNLTPSLPHLHQLPLHLTLV